MMISRVRHSLLHLCKFSSLSSFKNGNFTGNSRLQAYFCAASPFTGLTSSLGDRENLNSRTVCAQNFLCFSSSSAEENPSGGSKDGMKDMLKFIDEAVKSNKILLFMKGNPDNPQCGFSARIVAILKSLNVGDYSYVNVLESPIIREAIKVYTEWPTIPQLFVNGEFVGGCDIITGMHKDGELKVLLEKKGVYKENSASKEAEG